MSSICLPNAKISERQKPDIRRSIYSSIALGLIWAINILVVIFGLPFLIFGKLKYRTPKTLS